MGKRSVLKNETLKKALKITGDVLLYIIIALAMFVLVVSITSKKDSDGTATVFGKQLRFVQSESMAGCDLTDVSGYKIKSIPIKSCVFIDVVPENEEEKAEWYKNLQVGDVLTFKYVYTKQETITHRIVDIKEKETGGYIITLEGDNKNTDSNLLSQTIDTSLTESPNYVIGKVTGQSYLLGLLVYAFKTPVGIVCIVIIPCLIIIAFEVMRLIKVLSKDKKEKIKAEQEKQVNEIEELKRQLAALQANVESSQNAAMTAEQTQENTSVSKKTSQSKARKTTAKAGTGTRKKSTSTAEQTQENTNASKETLQSKTRKTTAKAGTGTRKKSTSTAKQAQGDTNASKETLQSKTRKTTAKAGTGTRKKSATTAKQAQGDTNASKETLQSKTRKTTAKAGTNTCKKSVTAAGTKESL